MSGAVVLVLDDEAEIAEFVADVVDMSDLPVTFISDCDQLETALVDSVQLLIMDLLMPKCSGVELIERVAQARSSLQLILMSGETYDFIEEAHIKASEMGLSVVGVLQKPFFAADLEALLEKSSLL